MGCANNRVTIDGLVRIEIKFINTCEVNSLFFFWGGGGGEWAGDNCLRECVFLGL